MSWNSWKRNVGLAAALGVFAVATSAARAESEAKAAAAAELEPVVADETSPVVLDLGDAHRGRRQRLMAALGRHDQLGASVAGVGHPCEVAEFGELVDQFRGRGQAEFGERRQFGQSLALSADVAPDLQMRPAHIAVAALGHRFAEFAPKLVQQTHQQLSDGEPISFFLEISREIGLNDTQRARLMDMRRRLRAQNAPFMKQLDSLRSLAGVELGETGGLTASDREALERFRVWARPVVDSIRVNNDLAQAEARQPVVDDRIDRNSGLRQPVRERFLPRVELRETGGLELDEASVTDALHQRRLLRHRLLRDDGMRAPGGA